MVDRPHFVAVFHRVLNSELEHGLAIALGETELIARELLEHGANALIGKYLAEAIYIVGLDDYFVVEGGVAGDLVLGAEELGQLAQEVLGMYGETEMVAGNDRRADIRALIATLFRAACRATDIDRDLFAVALFYHCAVTIVSIQFGLQALTYFFGCSGDGCIVDHNKGFIAIVVSKTGPGTWVWRTICPETTYKIDQPYRLRHSKILLQSVAFF